LPLDTCSKAPSANFFFRMWLGIWAHEPNIFHLGIDILTPCAGLL
jgi:hypothetical protein